MGKIKYSKELENNSLFKLVKQESIRIIKEQGLPIAEWQLNISIALSMSMLPEAQILAMVLPENMNEPLFKSVTEVDKIVKEYHLKVDDKQLVDSIKDMINIRPVKDLVVVLAGESIIYSLYANRVPEEGDAAVMEHFLCGGKLVVNEDNTITCI